MRSFASALAFLLVLLLPGCADRTALRLVIRTNLAVPAEMDAILIQMRSSTGASAPPRTVPLLGTPFPQTLVVRPEPGGMSGTVTFTVLGLSEGVIVIQRVVSATFRTGQILDVEADLNSDCLGVECGEGIDCVRGMCVGPRPDAGMPDAFVATEDAGIDAFVGEDAFSPVDAFAPGLDAFAVDAFVPGADAYREPDAFVPADAYREPDAFVPPDAFVIPDAFVPPDTGVACVGAGCAGIVLISEFTHTGPAGGLDEIVEIHNTSSGFADIGGARMWYTPASGTGRSGRATVPPGTRLPPGGFYLFGGSGYVGSPALDVAGWTSGASDTGGSWSLEVSGTVLDRVCWGSAVPSICEGTALAPLSAMSASSFERKANAASTPASMSAGGADERAGNRYDSGDNSVDFVVRPMREPQSSMSPAEP
jgi:hypothetical protein